MADSSPQHDPPSRPRPSLHGVHGPGGGGPSNALAHIQTVLALLLGILLFAVPLYLWRRPRSVQIAVRADAGAPEAARDAGQVQVAAPELTPPPPVKLADPRVLECHDRGSKRTPPEQCDHVVAFEKAFAEAIESSHDCVPKDAGAGSIEYVADLSFGRRRNPVTVGLPRDGRSFQSAKIAKDCAAGVRARLATFPVAPLTHTHARYKIAVVASYGATPGP